VDEEPLDAGGGAVWVVLAVLDVLDVDDVDDVAAFAIAAPPAASPPVTARTVRVVANRCRNAGSLPFCRGTTVNSRRVGAT
jgi:hypothetical protein